MSIILEILINKLYFLNKILKVSIFGKLSLFRENNVDSILRLETRVKIIFVDR